MENKLILPSDRVENVVKTHGNMLFRLCLITLGNASDAEDVVQETFLKYLQKAPVFRDERHEKAWLITVATNNCRDILRFKKRHPIVDTENIKEYVKGEPDNEILDALMTLPEKFRGVLILYYVEGYRIKEIARILGKTTSAVKMRLQKGRRMLKEAYEKEVM